MFKETIEKLTKLLKDNNFEIVESHEEITKWDIPFCDYTKYFIGLKGYSNIYVIDDYYIQGEEIFQLVIDEEAGDFTKQQIIDWLKGRK